MIRIKKLFENSFIIEIAENILNDYTIYHFVKRQGFLDKIIYKDTKGTKIADYRIDNGKYVIVLYNNFMEYYNKYGEDWAKEVLLHEVSHAFLDWYGMSNLIEKGYEYDIDVFNTKNLPFGEGNFHEAFSQTTALIILRDKKVKTMYPKWWKLVNNILENNRII